MNLAPDMVIVAALHDLSIDGKQHFLEGCGLPEKKICEMSPLMKAINLINYAPVIEGMAEAKEMEKLEQYRTRLNGALDFFSL